MAGPAFPLPSSWAAPHSPPDFSPAPAADRALATPLPLALGVESDPCIYPRRLTPAGPAPCSLRTPSLRHQNIGAPADSLFSFQTRVPPPSQTCHLPKPSAQAHSTPVLRAVPLLCPLPDPQPFPIPSAPTECSRCSCNKHPESLRLLPPTPHVFCLHLPPSTALYG